MHYELLYIIPAKYSEKELQPVINQVIPLIKKAGGEILRDDNLGRKKLAYPIKHVHQGYYILVEFDLKPNQLKGLNKDLKLMPEVLRHLIVKTKPKPISQIIKRKPFLKPPVEEGKEERLIKKEAPKEEREEEREKISIEELDKKIDELLKEDI